MSFSRELKDFVGAFSAGYKLFNDAEYNEARSKYYKEQVRKSQNPSEEEKRMGALKLEQAQAALDYTRARTAKINSGGSGRSGGTTKSVAPMPDSYFGLGGEGADAAEEEENETEDFANGGRVYALEDGGAIPAASSARDDDETAGQYWTQETARAETAGESKPSSLQEALGGGLRFLQKSFGLGEQRAALPGADPEREQKLVSLIRGDGAPSDQEMLAVRKAVDPKGEAGDGVVNAAVVERVYDFTKARSGEEAADRAAGSVLQYYAKQTSKAGALAQVALQNNDTDGAVKALVGGLNQVPDGRVTKLEGNKIVIADAKSGEVIQELPVTREGLAPLAKKMMDGSYYGYLAAKAAPAATPTPPPRPATLDARDQTADMPAEGAVPAGGAPFNQPAPPAAPAPAKPLSEPAAIPAVRLANEAGVNERASALPVAPKRPDRWIDTLPLEDRKKIKAAYDSGKIKKSTLDQMQKEYERSVKKEAEAFNKGRPKPNDNYANKPYRERVDGMGETFDSVYSESTTDKNGQVVLGSAAEDKLKKLPPAEAKKIRDTHIRIADNIMANGFRGDPRLAAEFVVNATSFVNPADPSFKPYTEDKKSGVITYKGNKFYLDEGARRELRNMRGAALRQSLDQAKADERTRFEREILGPIDAKNKPAPAYPPATTDAGRRRKTIQGISTDR